MLLLTRLESFPAQIFRYFDERFKINEKNMCSIAVTVKVYLQECSALQLRHKEVHDLGSGIDKLRRGNLVFWNFIFPNPSVGRDKQTDEQTKVFRAFCRFKKLSSTRKWDSEICAGRFTQKRYVGEWQLVCLCVSWWRKWAIYFLVFGRTTQDYTRLIAAYW